MKIFIIFFLLTLPFYSIAQITIEQNNSTWTADAKTITINKNAFRISIPFGDTMKWLMIATDNKEIYEQYKNKEDQKKILNNEVIMAYSPFNENEHIIIEDNALTLWHYKNLKNHSCKKIIYNGNKNNKNCIISISNFYDIQRKLNIPFYYYIPDDLYLIFFEAKKDPTNKELYKTDTQQYFLHLHLERKK